jgi:hypothetical protein
MDMLLGTTPDVFLGLTVILFGGAAFMTGQALAETWRPRWHAIPYAVLLGAGARFLTFALFEGTLLSVSGYVIGTAILLAVCLGAYRVTQVRRMVVQYPWLYERAGMFNWREKA